MLDNANDEGMVNHGKETDAISLQPNQRWQIAKHAVIGLTDNRGIFALMQDSDDTRYYAFSDEADVLAMQEQRIAELVQENERLQKHIDKLDKAAAKSKRDFDEQYARLGRAALDIAAELPAKKQKQAYSRLAVLGVRYDW